MASPTLHKSDPDDGMLGPPHNALLWQRAREMASQAHQNPSYSEILQLYQLLSIAPGFVAPHAFGKGKCLPLALRPRLSKKNVGGRGEGAWRYALAEANKRGKPKAYAVAVANRIMGKALTSASGISLPADDVATGRVRAAYASHTGPRLAGMAASLMDRMAPAPVPIPKRNVGTVAEVFSDINIDPSERQAAQSTVQAILKEAKSSKEAAQMAAQMLQAIGGIDGPHLREASLRVAFLHSLGDQQP